VAAVTMVSALSTKPDVEARQCGPDDDDDACCGCYVVWTVPCRETANCECLHWPATSNAAEAIEIRDEGTVKTKGVYGIQQVCNVWGRLHLDLGANPNPNSIRQAASRATGANAGPAYVCALV
jgi:hypothetical protein